MIPGDYTVGFYFGGEEERRKGVVEDGRRRWGESFIWTLAPQSAPRPSVGWMPSSYRGRKRRRDLHLLMRGCSGVTHRVGEK